MSNFSRSKFNQDIVNINRASLLKEDKDCSTMRRETSHDSNRELFQSQDEIFDDLSSPTFKSDSFPNKIMPLSKKYNCRVTSSEWVEGYQRDGALLLTSIEKKVVFSEDLKVPTSTNDDDMECEVSTSSETKTQSCPKKIKPLGKKYSNRTISSDWVIEYKKEGTELLPVIEEKVLFGNDMEELTNITEDGLPKKPAHLLSKFSDTEESFKDESTTFPPSMIGSLNSIRFGRMSSGDWVVRNILEDKKPLTEIFPELTEEPDQENIPETNRPCETPVSPGTPDADTCVHQKSKSEEGILDKEYSDLDVLFGRGGRGNHHAGNKKYRSLVNSRKKEYRKIKCKQAKTAIARSIVQKINSNGGRFLRYDKGKNKWIEVPSVRARTKVSQALRE